MGPPEYVLLPKIKNKLSNKKYHGLIQRWVSLTFFIMPFQGLVLHWQNDVGPRGYVLLLKISK